MKPRRSLFRSPRLFSAPLRYGVPVFLGFGVLITGAEGGDLLRGGGAAGAGSAPATGSMSGGTTPSTIETSRANARDALARNTAAIAAVQAMQNAARNAALNSSAQNLGVNPNAPGQTLPNVPNGLGAGGLQTTTGGTWTGADAPVQIDASGLTNVTIRQTAQQALLDWQTFNVGKNTTVTFDQTAGGANTSQWIAFNRINDPSGNPTQILGNIQAAGQVYLINRNGIIFGGSSQVNVHTLTASALPINPTLVENGLLNNPSNQFLFDALGTAGKTGDVTVQAGARLVSPTNSSNVGGRIALIGANVTNHGTIETPDGQTILAAGLQVGLTAHDSSDPSIRGLDVFVGAVTDPASVLTPYAGTTTNTGLIQAARGNITVTGKDVRQAGYLDSLTSISLNGSVNLVASYGAVANGFYNATDATSGNPFNFTKTGNVVLDENSVIRLLPDYASADKATGTALALRSKIQIQAGDIRFAGGSEILAPNALVSVQAGTWQATPSAPFAVFLNSTGQIHLNSGAQINLAGTTDATASVLQNYLTVTLRGSELAVAPLQRDSELRGDTIVVDVTKTGTYDGKAWVGTPLADVTGYLNLIERNIGQLTTAGGTLDLSAGSSVTMGTGSNIDVSGGWTNFTGDTVQTTRLWANGRLVDISEATPDQIYGGIFSGISTRISEKWGQVETFQQALAPTGSRYQESYTRGANAGSLSISAPALTLDGGLKGTTVAGTLQVRDSATSSNLPVAGTLALRLQAQILTNGQVYAYQPTPVNVIFGDASAADGNLHLSPELLTQGGFSNLVIENSNGNIVLPENVTLTNGQKGSISLRAANIRIDGGIISSGGALSFTALNLDPYQSALLNSDSQLPAANAGRGNFTLGSSGSISTAGLLIDDRGASTLSPVAIQGGSVSINAYHADLQSGGLIDVSGGYLLTANGKGSYGNGGSITVKAGQDPTVAAVLGGSLKLDSILRGYSGAKAGSLSLQAPRVQLGGSTAAADTLLLQAGFFNQGGFGTFTLTGLGTGGSTAVRVVSGTEIAPIVKSYEAVLSPFGSGSLSLQVIEDLPSERTAATLNLAAPGVFDLSNGLVQRGDVVVEAGSVLRTEPGGAVSATGNTVSILGSIITPGGTIRVGGGNSTFTVFNDANQARVTTFIGSQALLSAAGTTINTPDPYGRRTGRVLAGGTITLTGNIAASQGAVLDVSGTSATLDLPLQIASPFGAIISSSSGTTSDLSKLETVPVTVDSDGGNIILSGGQLLFSDATFLAKAGGVTALGGGLAVSSGRYDPVGTIPPATAVNLSVSQSGNVLSGAETVGAVVVGGGHFAVDRFTSGGFDSLTLGGVVSFQGNVDVQARSELAVASGGFITANGNVRLVASHISLGRPLAAPVMPGNEVSPFTGTFVPTDGSGSLLVEAELIDLGTLSLQNIGTATLSANGGDIWGSGSFHMAGNLTLLAGQIYPITASKLSLIAYDYQNGGLQRGSITVQASGTRQLPLSAGGTLNLYASQIQQQGTLRAPFGTINLGWDGTGTAPVDLISGSNPAVNFPVTKVLALGSGSVTSVSAVDPLTGKGITIPYGISTNGENWIDPRGVDITTGSVPEKSIILSGASVTTATGSNIDLRGGGDLYAYRWVEGLGGPSDILAATGTFAILPGYASDYAPVSEYNPSNVEGNLIAGSAGYTNATLKTGDRIYLEGSASLPAGYYTLLPARYALLPGAVTVRAYGGSGSTTIEMPDSSSIVSGYRYNSLNDARTVPTLASRFEIASSAVVRARAEYQDFFASTFLKSAALDAGSVVPRLPVDSGHLVFQANQAMEILGQIASNSISSGRGASIDISTPLATVITSGGAASIPGTITLDAATLAGFGAESLLIGGRRTTTADGIAVSVGTSSVKVDNAGTALTAQDLILVSKGSITLAAGAEIFSSGNLTTSDSLRIAGDGTLLRVSADQNATVLRSGVTSSGTPLLTVSAGATLSGNGIILDSSAGISLSANSDLNAKSYALQAGRIALQLDPLINVPATGGLAISNATLGELNAASALKLLSYSSIDLYGSGTFGGIGTLKDLTLSSGEIRGLQTGGGIARIAAESLRIGNSAAVTSTVGSGAVFGSLELLADTLYLENNSTAINGYSGVSLDASRGIIGTGTAHTPVIAGAAGAKRTLSATGAVSLLTGTRTSGQIVSSGLGSTLSITGSSVDVNTGIVLPSGSLALRATSGALTVNSLLDVSGTVQNFHDVTKVTSAGNITLAADAGNVVLTSLSSLKLSSPSVGGNGGTLTVSTPAGSFTTNGSILGAGGNNGTNGSFSLDVLSLGALASLNSILASARLTESQQIRVRSGNVIIDGTAKVRDFSLSADQGDITVTGTVDASGRTGGSIHLSANGSVTTAAGSHLTVAGETFSSSGKGGEITLESGSQRNGVVGTGSIDLQTGSTLDLSVAAKTAASAAEGHFSGKLHLRAPRTSANNDLRVNAINASILDASSILVEGYKLYDLTSSGGTITTTVQSTARTESTSYLGAAGTTTANYTSISNRLLANNSGLSGALVLAPGVELINRTGNLTLGTTSSTTSSDWDLSSWRFGAKSAPGVLTLRAAGDLVFCNALSDGFSPTLASSDTSWLWTSRLSTQNLLLPVNEQSWHYRLTAGADLAAADFSGVLALEKLAANTGSLRLGKTGTNISTTSGAAATTSSAIANRFQVIRTGSGDIDINAGRDLQILNQFSTIYTAGVRLTDFTLGGLFRLPSISSVSSGGLGNAQQSYAVLFSMAGGDVNIHAGEDIERLTLSSGQLVADSQFQMPTNWLYRRGDVDANGTFSSGANSVSASTTWWVDFSNFFQGVGALGGGDVTLVAGRNISNVDAVIPTNGRMPGYTTSAQTQRAAPDASKLVELGGGDLIVRAGNNIDAGVYYIERGHGTLQAGGSILTNATRSVLAQSNITAGQSSSYTELPTTLFLGKGGYDIDAFGDLLLGPVSNPFLLPGGQLNGYFNKSYFSTYSADSYVRATTLGGDLTLRSSATLPGQTAGDAIPILQSWFTNKLLFNPISASNNKPWLRLNETSTTPFGTLFQVRPGTLQTTSFSGNVNLVGNLILSPSASGTVDLLARRSIQALQPNGLVTLNGVTTTTWGTSSINLSDANPEAIPGISKPYGFQTNGGTNADITGPTLFLDFINLLFAESGGTLGQNVVLSTRQNLHAAGLLHRDDVEPLRLYADEGDISGLTLFSPKSSRILAGQDISDVAIYLQNLRASDTSLVSAGRDLIAYATDSLLRQAATSARNALNISAGSLAGDIQISGPGSLQVLAGRNLDLGANATSLFNDGTGSGITSIGNTRNPYLPDNGAGIFVAAGLGANTGLNASRLNLTAFIEKYVNTPAGGKYLEKIQPGVVFAAETPENQARLAVEVLHRILRDAGRDFQNTDGYDIALAAIANLFGTITWDGEINLRDRDIRTANGGDISILAPGGGVTLASTTLGSTLAPPGIVTAGGGNISIFAKDDISIGIGRIFTLRGGNEIIWSSEGDIAAGSSSKTVQTASPTRVRIDPQSATVQTDLSGLATGGGIGVLTSVKGIPAGDVDLIAPLGTVDAGDAGIRVSGNLNISAAQVLNAANISVAGNSAGTPVSVSAVPGVGSLTAASTASAATTTSTAQENNPQAGQAPVVQDEPSLITVEVLGYGGSADDEEEESEGYSSSGE